MPQSHYYDDYHQKHHQQQHQQQPNYHQHYQHQFGINTAGTIIAPPPRKHLNIVHYCLNEKDLSKAGLLFTLNNDTLLNEFPVTIETLKRIIDSKNYANNFNEQSIVEIVLTRCTSALRYTNMLSYKS